MRQSVFAAVVMRTERPSVMSIIVMTDGSSALQTYKERMMKSKKNQLLDDLKQQILTMKLKPGQDLDETEITTKYQLSRTPVREIFRHLSGLGYIELRENRGARVAPMSYLTLRNFFIAAPIVYEATARLAVHNFTPEQLDDLKQTQERFRDAGRKGDTMAMVIENNRFHEIIGEMSGNVYLQPSLSRLLIDHARIGCTFFHPHNEGMERKIDASIAHHDQFIEAITARDEKRIARLSVDHLDLSRRNMEAFIAPKGMVPEGSNWYAA